MTLNKFYKTTVVPGLPFATVYGNVACVDQASLLSAVKCPNI